MNIKPLRNHLFVKRAEPKDKVGNILVPDQAKNRPNEGTVVKSAVEGVNEGDRIMFGTYNGAKFEINGDELMCLKADEVLGTIVAI